MEISEGGYQFWKQFDELRDHSVSLKTVINQCGLNYELIKVQRSLNRIPKAHEVAALAHGIKVPMDYLLLEPKNITQMERSILSIFQALQKADDQTIESIQSILNIAV